MKPNSLILFMLLHLFFSELTAQTGFIPLKIDSSYTWSFSVGWEGDTFMYESWAGYTYDSNDSLVQSRYPGWRRNYSYDGTTTFGSLEMPDGNGNWVLTNRSTIQYDDNGRLLSSFTETLEQGTWLPYSLSSYEYNSQGKETLYLVQTWGNASWQNFFHRDKLYDANSNKTEEAEYFYNNGQAAYNKGTLYEYDAQNRLAQEISVNSSINGPYYSSRLNWHYNSEGQLDTLTRCNYQYSTQNCVNGGMATYEYFGADSIRESQFFWTNNDWKYVGKFLSFPGPSVYGPEHDSILFFYFVSDTLGYVITSRQYYHYEELPDGKIFFSQYFWSYKPSLAVWMLDGIEQRWYHKAGVVRTSETNKVSTGTFFWPNPCQAGQSFNLKGIPQAKDISIGIFDVLGKQLSLHNISDFDIQTQLIAPLRPGIYPIVIFKGGIPAETQKLIVH